MKLPVADERLRRLERCWKETGAPQDEAAYLIEQLRLQGDLPWGSYSRLAELDVPAAMDLLLTRLQRGSLQGEHLRLAALLGHEPARRGSGSPEPWDLLDPRRAWLEALNDWGRGALRVGLISMPDEGRIRATIAILNVTTRGRGMTRCQLAQVQAALRIAEADVASPTHEFLDGAPLYAIAEAGGEDVYSPARCLTKCFVDSELSSGWPQSVASLIIDQLELVTPAEAAHVIKQELLPWALGCFDPIRERVLLRKHMGANDADNTRESRGWIQASSILTVNPASAVSCPSCREADLRVSEQAHNEERLAVCPACGRRQRIGGGGLR